MRSRENSFLMKSMEKLAISLLGKGLLGRAGADRGSETAGAAGWSAVRLAEFSGWNLCCFCRTTVT